jgi:hypothetical protein
MTEQIQHYSFKSRYLPWQSDFRKCARQLKNEQVQHNPHSPQLIKLRTLLTPIFAGPANPETLLDTTTHKMTLKCSAIFAPYKTLLCRCWSCSLKKNKYESSFNTPQIKISPHLTFNFIDPK